MIISNMGDKNRQNDEIAAMTEIYDADEFVCSSKDDTSDLIECTLSGIFALPEKMLKVKYLNHNIQRSYSKLPYLRFFVRHLPPAKLHATLPSNYPSENPPNFRLDVNWLPTMETSRICEQLDDLWAENQGSEILFIWMNFLKFELLSFLKIEYCLDVSILFTAFQEPDDYMKSDVARLIDARAHNSYMFLNPKVYLMEYDARRHQIEFQKRFYTCIICFDTHSGEQCVEFLRCGHICCKSCTKEYVDVKITDGKVNALVCPEQKCKSELTPDQVKELVSPQLFEKYERLLLQVTLDSMNDIVYCPRVKCQYPVSKDGDDTLATCANCRYNFCVYCGKGYHGVEPCTMTSEDQKNLILKYKAANHQERKLLEKKHGRKQLQLVVEKYLSKVYIEENTKPCPKCSTPTIKIEGCNKMMCSHCQAHFCWLCGKHLTDPDPYDHFRKQTENPCYQRLFEGIDIMAEFFEDEIEGDEAWEEFHMERLF